MPIGMTNDLSVKSIAKAEQRLRVRRCLQGLTEHVVASTLFEKAMALYDHLTADERAELPKQDYVAGRTLLAAVLDDLMIELSAEGTQKMIKKLKRLRKQQR